jgi:hypothetical protein
MACKTPEQREAEKDATLPNPFEITKVSPGEYRDYRDYISKQSFQMKAITADVLTPYIQCVAGVYYYIASPDQRTILDNAARSTGLTPEQADDFTDDFYDDNEPDENLADRIRFNCGPQLAALRPQVREAYGDKAADGL